MHISLRNKSYLLPSLKTLFICSASYSLKMSLLHSVLVRSFLKNTNGKIKFLNSQFSIWDDGEGEGKWYGEKWLYEVRIIYYIAVITIAIFRGGGGGGGGGKIRSDSFNAHNDVPQLAKRKVSLVAYTRHRNSAHQKSTATLYAHHWLSISFLYDR